MGTTAVLKINEFFNSESVISPVLYVSPNTKALTLVEIMEMFEQRMVHEETNCNSSENHVMHL
ncbi:hypothetical protein [Lysinibacillus sphaericus]|uniref:hypothetical protein n=1 Tax=Lysinibacillus sphaericus TaxID=1421 RepID=UPI003D7FF2FD